MKLRYLHISDLHLTCQNDTGDGWAIREFNQDFVTTSMLDAISRLIQQGLAIDMLLVTGDLARRGKSNEYQVVEVFCSRLLEETGVPTEHLFVVPGNHDVDRDEVTESHIRWWYQFADQNQIAEVLSSGDVFPILMRKFGAFNEFVSRVTGRSLYDQKQYYAVESPCFEKNGEQFRINIVELNSALFAGYDGDDQGRLAFGLHQVDGALRQLDQSATLNLVLFHHPVECFHRSDQVCLNQLVNVADIIVTGHLHEPANAFVKNAAGQAVMIGAGACFENRETENSFNLVEIDLETGKGLVQFYKYLPLHNRWVKNRDVNPSHSDGAFAFEIERIMDGPSAKTPGFPGVIYEAQDEQQQRIGIEIDILDAAHAILVDAGQALHYREITRRMVAQHLAQTDADLPKKVYRRLTYESKKSKPTSRFKRVAPGVFMVAPDVMSLSLRLTGESREFYYQFPKSGHKYLPLGATLVVPNGWIARVTCNDFELGIFNPGCHKLDTDRLAMPDQQTRVLDRYDARIAVSIKFIRTSPFQFLWGTPTAVPMPDPDWQSVVVRARGHSTLRIADLEKFLHGVRTRSHRITPTIVSIMASAFGQLVCERYESARDLRSLHLGVDRLRELASEPITCLGIEVQDVLFEAIQVEPYACIVDRMEAERKKEDEEQATE
jgi:predicted phosphodiesterase